LRRTKFNPRYYRWEATGESWSDTVDELVLAVPPITLARLVRRGTAGQRIVDADKDLAELSRLRTERVPILHACFKDRLEGVPAQPVGLLGSRLNLAFTDISQTWQEVPEFRDRTVCAVSCSDTGGLAGANPTVNGYEILAELAEYLDFDAGAAWEQSPAIDWQLTRYHENYDAELSLNAVGTDIWRPSASCPGISNLSFAGDFCLGQIGLTTIESAVASGLQAVNAIVWRRGVGSEIEVLRPRTLPPLLYVLFRYAGAPYVLGAKAWSMGISYSRAGEPDRADDESLVRYLLTPGLPPRHQRFDS
jgi:hypothetical protein